MRLGIGDGGLRSRLNGYRAVRLATFLESAVGRVVVDRTRLTGVFDIELSYLDDNAFVPGNERREYPALFTALQEQLGLRLQSARGPVPVVVVDHAEPATND